MKNIMLLGITRSGKSTFANMLHDKYNYNIIHGDMIKASYQKHIENLTSAELKKKDEYRMFIKDIFNHEVKYNETNCIIDTVDIFPSDITDEDREKYLIYFFGYPNIEYDELVSIWRSKDQALVRRFSEEELESKAKRGIENSKKIMEECSKYNLRFIDTSHNRDETFAELLEEIEKELGRDK